MRFSLTLVGTAVATRTNPTPVGMNFSQFGSTITGISWGFFEQQMPNIVHCGMQSEEVVGLIEKSFTDMQQGTSDGIGNSFIDIGQTIKLIPRAAGECSQDIATDVAAFGELSDSFKDFTTFTTTIGENWLLNGDVVKRWSAANAFAA